MPIQIHRVTSTQVTLNWPAVVLNVTVAAASDPDRRSR
jgi:hypothetical protein